MAKAMEFAEVGDQVEIIKDDNNRGEFGTVLAVDEFGIMDVGFSFTTERFDYSPDEVVLHKED